MVSAKTTRTTDDDDNKVLQSPNKKSRDINVLCSERHYETSVLYDEENVAAACSKVRHGGGTPCSPARSRRFIVLSSEEEDNVPMEMTASSWRSKRVLFKGLGTEEPRSTSSGMLSSAVTRRLEIGTGDDHNKSPTKCCGKKVVSISLKSTSTMLEEVQSKPEADAHAMAAASSHMKRVLNNPLHIDEEDESLDPAQKVKKILRQFNSYYLRFVQEEELRCRKEATDKPKPRVANDEGKQKNKSRRPDLKAISQMKMEKKVEQRGKVLGNVPGINVGDHFFSRCEMVAIGLHCHWLGGIDMIAASSKKKLHLAKLPVASSIVLSGNYEDDIDNSEEVVYTGSGGNDLLGNKRQIADQKLTRGNLALKNNMDQDVPVRLVRGHKTKKSYTGKVYTYDGLYKVKDYWAEKGISGFTVYKFRLKRVEGQPILTTNQVHFVSGQLVPANISEVKGLVCADISNGLERTPIPATNLHNYPVAPNDFRYTNKVERSKGLHKPLPAKGCSCKGECIDPNKCACAILNGKRFPYVAQNGGRLVEPMDVVYECGPQCGCSKSCSNRVTQKGMQYRLEAFQTSHKGWGVRSWDTIPAGAPVCQYTGTMMRSEDAGSIISHVYVFGVDCLQTIKGLGNRQRRLRGGVDLDDLADVPDQPEYSIDAGSCGNVSRLINHSCDPNLFVQCVVNDHHDLSQASIWFFAADTIHPLEELSYDYGYEIGSVVDDNGHTVELPCYCGARQCKMRLY